MSKLISSMSPTHEINNDTEVDNEFNSVIDAEVRSEAGNEYVEYEKTHSEKVVVEEQGEKHKIGKFEQESISGDSDVVNDSIYEESENEIENITGIEEDIQLVESRSKKRRKRKKKKKNN